MATSAAYPGVKAVFKDVNAIDPEIQFDVVLWLERNGSAEGLIIVPEFVQLYQAPHAPVPSNYYFAGYAYCPQ